MDRNVESRDDPRALALGWLARRPLCQAEVRKRLGARGVSSDHIEQTVAALVAERLLDDEALALDFIVLRSGRLRQGRGRLIRDLERRGVDRAVAERAYDRAVEDGDLDPHALLVEAVATRLGRERERERELTPGALRRVYNALLRAGFPAEGLYAELERQRAAIGSLEHE